MVLLIVFSERVIVSRKWRADYSPLKHWDFYFIYYCFIKACLTVGTYISIFLLVKIIFKTSNLLCWNS